MVLTEDQFRERQARKWVQCLAPGCYSRATRHEQYCVACQLDGRAPLPDIERDKRLEARRENAAEALRRFQESAATEHKGTFVVRTQAFARQHRTAQVLPHRGALTWDRLRFRFLANGLPLRLKPAMYMLLVRLFERHGEVVTYRELSEDLFNDWQAAAWGSLRVHVRWLRMELARHPGAPTIVNMREFGYMLEG